MSFVELVENVAKGFEAFGVAVFILGLLWSIVLAALVWARTKAGREAYSVLRESFGGALLLGLEILVAADLIRTVAVAPTLTNVGERGLIVLIRTFLSFSLQVEIDGVVPWRRATVSGAGLMGRATRRAQQKVTSA